MCCWPSGKLTIECQKMYKFLAIFWHSIGNFPEGQVLTIKHTEVWIRNRDISIYCKKYDAFIDFKGFPPHQQESLYFIIIWLTRFQLRLKSAPAMSGLASKWVRLVPNWTNLGLFKNSFSTFWLGAPKCTETDLKKF